MSLNPVTDDVWFAGSFTSFAGQAGSSAKYDGTTATAWAISGGDGTGYSIDFDSAGKAFVCGSFTTFDSQSINNVGQSVDDGANWTQVGAGLATGFARAIAVDPANETQLWVGGNSLPGTNTNAKFYDGATWVELPNSGTGPNSSVTVVRANPNDNHIWYGGNFSQWDGVTVDNLVEYDGAAWADPTGGVAGYSIIYNFRFHDYPQPLADLGTNNISAANLILG